MLTSTLAFDVPVMPPVELPDIGHAWFGGEGGVGEVSELGRWFWAGVAIRFDVRGGHWVVSY